MQSKRTVCSSSVVVLLVLGVLFQLATPAKILFFLPIASKSHVHVFEPLIRALGQRGHEVVSMAPVKLKEMPKSVRQVAVVSVDEVFGQLQTAFEMRKMGKLAQLANSSALDLMNKGCEKILDSAELKEIMAAKDFDLVIVDILLNYCVLGVVPELNAPFIYTTTMVAPNNIMEVVGNRLPPSFTPSVFNDFTDRMTFLERVTNFFYIALIDFLGQVIFIPKLEAIYKGRLGAEKKGILEISNNVSMIFVNSHFTLTYPRPYLPDVVDVGGMHTKPAQALPKDLEEFVSGAEHGCIFFSLGSIAQGKDMPEEYRKVFVKVFSRLEQRVLWKWETETMSDQPKNVKLSKWLPQQDILGHNNTVLFMTHGGLLSIQETVYHGVPLLGIPLFADQDLNIKQAVKAGFAVSLEILEITEDILEAKLKELLGNPSYLAKVQELSSVWKDQPQTPLENAIFWSEYVIRHKGAMKLRSAARDLNFFQYHSLDVIAFLSLIALIFLYIGKCILQCVWRKICGRDKTKNASTSLHSKKRN